MIGFRLHWEERLGDVEQSDARRYLRQFNEGFLDDDEVYALLMECGLESDEVEESMNQVLIPLHNGDN